MKTSLPTHIFFTGVPGSRWSGISQVIEQVPGINTSDQSADRQYSHHAYSGHRGAYFGNGMEFPANLNEIDTSAWQRPGGCKILKSHDWAYQLDNITQLYSNVWIMLVYRPDQASYDWWQEAGGFNIKYPSYDWYENNEKMMQEIQQQNSHILDFAIRHNLKWELFNSNWIFENFGVNIPVNKVWPDIKVTILK